MVYSYLTRSTLQSVVCIDYSILLIPQLSADLLVLWILFGAALSDFSRLSPFEASIPVVGILGLTPWLPSGPR